MFVEQTVQYGRQVDTETPALIFMMYFFSPFNMSLGSHYLLKKIV